MCARRKGHGTGAGSPRIEVLPPDEQPAGVQAPALVEGTGERDAGGRFRKGARSAQSAGGQTAREKTRLGRKLALGETFRDARFEPYAQAAKAFRRQHVTALARDIGGGHCGTGPASIIASAALQLAASRFAFEVLGDLTLGSRLANDSRQNLLAAHELVAREAAARAHLQGDDLARQQREFQRQAQLRAQEQSAASLAAQNDEATEEPEPEPEPEPEQDDEGPDADVEVLQ